ncbi:MAG: carboxypeptidase regulatory-like domain-containing protein [bacterium]|nr:carboxypeptidase regulatory-like domain-containing protein [bacterium]
MKGNRGAMGNYNLYGDRHLHTPNEPNAVGINYFLNGQVTDDVKITITNPYGNSVSSITGTHRQGINKVLWRINRVDPGEYVITLEADGKSFRKQAKIYELNEK